MRLILDTSWNGLDVSALDAELTLVSKHILRDDVTVKPGIADDGQAYLDIVLPVAPAAEVEPLPVFIPTYVVEVNDKYTYLVEPAEFGLIAVGAKVDLPGQHEGAHWQGTVTRVMSVDDFEDTEGDLPSRKVLGVVD